jgi:tripartite-type tricarboxylate transporter receptor subunit TctC
MRVRTVVAFSCVVSILILCSGLYLGLAADYPTKPITLINVHPPGGFLDAPGRTYAIFAEKLLGKPMIIVNKPGASGMIGSVAGAQAPPDGYTLTLGCSSIPLGAEWEIVNGRKPMVSQEDFTLIGSFILSPTLISVPYNSPWKTLADLVKDCQEKPDHYAFSTGGLYGMGHLAAELLVRTTGIKCRNVPYKGGLPAVSAVVGGHVDFTTQFSPQTIPLYKGKKLKILAIQSDKRLKAIPEVPTVKEQGVDAEYQAWVGILAPKKTPLPIVEKLREVTAKVANDKAFIEAIEGTEEVVRYMNHVEFSKYWEMESNMAKKIWTQLVKVK